MSSNPNSTEIQQNSEYPKIYKPKPKKLCMSHNLAINKNSYRKHFLLSPTTNSKMSNKNKKDFKLDIDDISVEEIESDFNILKARSEIIEVENELLSLIRNSTKDNSLEEDNRNIIKNKRPKRPKRPFLENLE